MQAIALKLIFVSAKMKYSTYASYEQVIYVLSFLYILDAEKTKHKVNLINKLYERLISMKCNV